MIVALDGGGQLHVVLGDAADGPVDEADASPRRARACWRLSVTASSEPCTSAFTIRFSVAVSPRWICSKMSSSLAPEPTLPMTDAVDRWSRKRRALRAQPRRPCGRCSVVLGGAELVAGGGGSLKPSTWTGVDGKASLTCLPLSSMSARTLPQAAPATMKSPTRRVPFSTSTVATGPGRRRGWPRGRRRGRLPSGLAVSSSRSTSHEEHLLEELVDALAPEGRDRHRDRVAAPVLGHEARGRRAAA